MSREYKAPIWPRRYPQWTLIAVAAVILCTLFTARYQRQHLGDGLQKWYLWRYALATYRADTNDVPRRVDVLVAYGSRYRLEHARMLPSAYRGWLKESVYNGTPAWRILWLSILVFVASLGSFLPLGVWLDRRHKFLVQQGVNRRGPELVSIQEFNRKIQGDGLTFFLHPDHDPQPKPYRPGLPYVRIRKRDEVMNIGLSGNAGSGKGSLIKQMLYQVRERGDAAVINDPKREYMEEFYDEEQGDIILDPSDERCPYWEFRWELPRWNKWAVALTIANSILPKKPNEHEFFRDNSRKLIAHLISKYQPTAEELIRWSSEREEIQRRVSGTSYAAMLSDDSPDMREGIHATFNEIMSSLRMLPPDPNGRRIWSAKRYVRERRGWIFVPSSPTMADALRPIQSMWLDLLLIHQLAAGSQKHKPAIWNVLDEVDTLKKLPKLPDAMTKMRFTGNRMVVAFQDAVQLEEEYGKLWKSILSNCFAYFILRTKEPSGSEWGQGVLGKVSNDRIRETRTQSKSIFERQGRSYSEEHRDEPLVLASEIQILEPTQGYLSYGKCVLPFKAPYFPPPERPKFRSYIERHIDVDPVSETVIDVEA